MEEAGQLQCSICQKSFCCDIKAGKAHCWCFDKPPNPQIPEKGSSCLCPQCLDKSLEQVKALDT